MNVMRRHYQNVMASKEATAAAADPDRESMAGLSEYEQNLAKLNTHVAQLKNVQSTERKVEMKRTFVGDYAPYIDAQLAAEPGKPDLVLTQVMVWLLDVQQYERAFEVAMYSIEHKLPMPERFKRDTATYAAEVLAEAAIDADGKEGIPAPGLNLLADLMDVTHECDMPDEVKAKLHKALAFALEATGDPDRMVNALFHLNRALDLNGRCGVKKRRDALDKRVHTPAPDSASGDTNTA